MYSWLAPGLFRETSRSAFPEFFQLVCLLVLWPFAPSGFQRLSSLLRPLLTSAQALARQTSPSKVSSVSTRVVGLYLLRLSVTVGFRIPEHTLRPQAASLPLRVPTIVSLLLLLSAQGLAAWALLFATVAVTASDQFLSFDYI